MDTAYEVWQTLLNRFTQKSVAREFELRGKLQACQKRDRALAVYLREYKSIYDQLKAIGKPVDEITKLFEVLEGLGSEYEGFKTTIYCLKPQPEYDEVISHLERFEARLQNYSSNQFSSNLAYYGQRKTEILQREYFDREPAQQNVSFGGPRGYNRGGRSYGRRRPFNSGYRNYGYSRRNISYRLNNSSHDQGEQQFKQFNTFSGIGSGQGFRPYAGSSQRNSNIRLYPSNSSNLTLHKNLQENKTTDNTRLECQICKRPGHDALHYWYRFDNSYQAEEIPIALAAMHLEESNGNEWYPDTGATAHITTNAVCI